MGGVEGFPLREKKTSQFPVQFSLKHLKPIHWNQWYPWFLRLKVSISVGNIHIYITLMTSIFLWVKSCKIPHVSWYLLLKSRDICMKISWFQPQAGRWTLGHPPGPRRIRGPSGSAGRDFLLIMSHFHWILGELQILFGNFVDFFWQFCVESVDFAWFSGLFGQPELFCPMH